MTPHLTSASQRNRIRNQNWCRNTRYRAIAVLSTALQHMLTHRHTRTHAHIHSSVNVAYTIGISCFEVVSSVPLLESEVAKPLPSGESDCCNRASIQDKKSCLFTLFLYVYVEIALTWEVSSGPQEFKDLHIQGYEERHVISVCISIQDVKDVIICRT